MLSFTWTETQALAMKHICSIIRGPIDPVHLATQTGDSNLAMPTEMQNGAMAAVEQAAALALLQPLVALLAEVILAQ